MKKALLLLLSVILVITLASCGAKYTVDYEDEADFEAALNEGVDVVGKVVKITAKDLVPDSAFGYNVHAGEHLNFCSEGDPKVEVGDELIVKVTKVTEVYGSYVLNYELLKK